VAKNGNRVVPRFFHRAVTGFGTHVKQSIPVCRDEVIDTVGDAFLSHGSDSVAACSRPRPMLLDTWVVRFAFSMAAVTSLAQTVN
jgi:hypothetical protein